MESYVHSKIEADDISFMPAYRAMSIKNDGEEKDNIENKIKIMISKIEELNAKLQK